MDILLNDLKEKDEVIYSFHSSSVEPLHFTGDKLSFIPFYFLISFLVSLLPTFSLIHSLLQWFN